MRIKHLKEYMRRDRVFGQRMKEILRPGRKLGCQTGLTDFASSSTGESFATPVVPAVTDDDPVNLVSSEVGHGLHAPAIDIDCVVTVLESRTPGHSHVYIDKLLTEYEYDKLLTTLFEIGLLERGVLDAFKTRGATHLRLPLQESATGYLSSVY